jgi:hypothetical protein
MFADTNAIRALGSAHAVEAADLAAIAARLAALPTGASLLGPVGARFMAALSDAAADASRAVAALSDSVSASATTAQSSATAYEAADHRLGASLTGA